MAYLGFICKHRHRTAREVEAEVLVGVETQREDISETKAMTETEDITQTEALIERTAMVKT